MARRILKTLTNNIGFKILAVFLALILWIVVYNIEDPKKTKSFSVNVSLENEEAVAGMNKCYEILDSSNTVRFSVTAKRSIIEKLEDSDFVAVADMSKLEVLDDGTSAQVEINISSPKYGSSVKVTGGEKFLEVALEDLLSVSFDIKDGTEGTVADGYALGEVKVINPTRLKVSGPKSIVESVDSVVASINVEGAKTSFSDYAIPKLYDKNGNEVDSMRLTTSTSSVSVSVQILKTKAVPVNFSTKGVPAGGKNVVGIVSDPSTILLKGTDEQLAKVSAINVNENELNVEGASENVTKTIDISSYIPEGVSLVNESDAKVDVTVEIESFITRNFRIKTSNFEINGVEDGYSASFGENKITVSISGMKSDLDKLDVEKLKGSVDASGLGEGKHTVTLTLKLDKNKFSVGTIRIVINVVSNQNDDDDEGEE